MDNKELRITVIQGEIASLLDMQAYIGRQIDKLLEEKQGLEKQL